MSLECITVVVVASFTVVSAVALSGVFLIIAVLFKNHFLQNPKNKQTHDRKQAYRGENNG